MHPTNKSTINGTITKEQRTRHRQQIWRWFNTIYKRKKKKNGSISRKGIQVSYGLLSRKFGLSYKQVRRIMDYFTTQKYLIKWTPPIKKDTFKTKGNYYQLNYFG